jgi:NAD(P)-dependent dehydrogenase (short-subunit alcohol dehydrogenase family)
LTASHSSLELVYPFSDCPPLLIIDQGADGIGKETGFAFAEAGASSVLFADINEHGATESAEASKKYATHPMYRAIGIKVNVTDRASVQAMVDKAVKEFGRIDYSVNCAGVCIPWC